MSGTTVTQPEASLPNNACLANKDTQQGPKSACVGLLKPLTKLQEARSNFWALSKVRINVASQGALTPWPVAPRSRPSHTTSLIPLRVPFDGSREGRYDELLKVPQIQFQRLIWLTLGAVSRPGVM